MNSIPITGFVRAVLKNKAGDVLEIVESENLVVTTGNSMVTGRLVDNAVNLPRFAGWGSSPVAVASADAGLNTEYLVASTWPGYARATMVVGASSGNRVERTLNILNFVFDLINNSGTGSKTIHEIGLFDVVTEASGVMLARWLTGGIALGASDTLSVNWQLTIGT